MHPLFAEMAARPSHPHRPLGLLTTGQHDLERRERASLLDDMHRLQREHEAAQQQPGALARQMADRFNPSRRILLALDHAERQQRYNPHDHQLQESLWAFQPFSMSVGALLLAALTGCEPSQAQPRARVGLHLGPSVPREHLVQALAHVERYGQAHDAMWPHQAFSLTYGELLQAALRA